MGTVTNRSSNPAAQPHLRWVAVLVTGFGLFAAVLMVTLSTRDPIYLPCLLLLGAAVVPVTLATFVADVEPAHRLSMGSILAAGVLGGVIGGVLAGHLEFDSARSFGLSFTLIGLIEESAKLAVPAALLAWRAAAGAAQRERGPRPGAVDGLVLGVAVGSAFAAVETMGYGFVVLLHAGGNLAPVADVLALRAVGSLGGHAAWTGLACAALFAVPNATRRGLGWLRFAGVFASVVALHAGWDRAAGTGGDLAVGVISFAALMAVTWWLHRTRTTPSVAAGGGISVQPRLGRYQPSAVQATATGSVPPAEREPANRR